MGGLEVKGRNILMLVVRSFKHVGKEGNVACK